MKGNTKKKFNVFLVIMMSMVLALTGCGSGNGADTGDDHPTVKVELASLLEFDGDVMVTSSDTEIAAYDGMRFMAEDLIATGNDSHACLDLDQNRVLMMDENTELKIVETDDGLLEINLVVGRILNDIEPGGGKYTVRTPDTTMAVLGTLFSVEYNPRPSITTRINLFEGSVLVWFPNYDDEKTFEMKSGTRFIASVKNIEDALDTGELPTTGISIKDYSENMLDHLKGSLESRAKNATGEEIKVLNDMVHSVDISLNKFNSVEGVSNSNGTTNTQPNTGNNSENNSKDNEKTPVTPDNQDTSDPTDPVEDNTSGGAIDDNTSGGAIDDNTSGGAIDDNTSGGAISDPYATLPDWAKYLDQSVKDALLKVYSNIGSGTRRPSRPSTPVEEDNGDNKDDPYYKPGDEDQKPPADEDQNPQGDEDQNPPAPKPEEV